MFKELYGIIRYRALGWDGLYTMALKVSYKL